MTVGQCFYVKRLRTLETIGGYLSHQIAELIYLTLLLMLSSLTPFTVLRAFLHYEIIVSFLLRNVSFNSFMCVGQGTLRRSPKVHLLYQRDYLHVSIP